jgi:hypothetical protein
MGAAALLAAAPAAAAHGVGARLTFGHASVSAVHAATPSSRIMFGVGNVHDGACAAPPAGAGFVRVVAGWAYEPGHMLACALAARQARLPVELVVQWSNALSLPEIRARVAQTLALFTPATPFAVALGNEQEFSMTGNAPAPTPAVYAQTWRALEPMLARMMPAALRVAGEVSPWGNPFMRDAAAAGLPGAQAYAEHVYPSGLPAEMITAPFLRVARAHGVLAFADEGACGPSSWWKLGCIPAATLAAEGFALAAEWYVP